MLLALVWVFVYSPLWAAPHSVKLAAGKRIVEARIARTPSELGQGLSGVSDLGEDEGMLFILPRRDKVRFCMASVGIPLSIAYLDSDGRVLKIEDMDPDSPGRMYETPDQARFALEMNQGWFKRYGLKEGDRIERRS